MSILEKWCLSHNSKLVSISDIGFEYKNKKGEKVFMLYKELVNEVASDNFRLQ